MTVTQFLDQVRRLHNENNAQTPYWSDSEIYGLIENKANEVLSFIGLVETKDTSLTTTADQADYTIPTNILRIRRVRVDGRDCKYITMRQYFSRTPQGVLPSGTPREWTQFDGTLTLIPKPSTSSLQITIFGEAMQSSITSSSSTIDIPAVFHHALVDGVVADMFAKDLNPEWYDRFQARWVGIHIPHMKDFNSKRNRVGSPTVITDTDSNVETEMGLI
jgi:hypothetical protein